MKLSTRKLFGYLVVIVPIISSLIYSKYFYNSFEYPKFILLLVSSYLLVVFIIKLKLSKSLKGLILDSRANKLALIFILFVLVSDILGILPTRSLWGSPIRHQGFVSLISFFIIYFSVQLIDFSSQKIIVLFTKVAEIVIWIMGIVGIFQIIGVYLFRFPIPLFQGRLILTFGNPDFLGVFLVMILPFFLTQNTILEKKKIIKKIILLIVIEILIVFTQSLSALIASLIIYFTWVTLMKKKFFIAIFISLIIFLTLFSVPQNLKKYSIWDNRQIIFTQAITKIVQRPIFGYGQENFELVFPKELNYHVDSSHNIFLDTLLASGIIGFIPFFLFLILQMRNGLQVIRLSILGYLFAAMFNPLSIANILLSWFFMGINSKYINELNKKSVSSNT